ncbi:GMC family oxidoreductase N-terminal domain-containing protein [Enterovibrio sp. ZSDZ35]|uniref:GMC family oxidoreductase N-terminal domain-containing protein n=1 Tax=Enterovibrio qingdaonensis TaxID=2899818 RepID=A0ABT5QP65_9GAMM|nr:GMC family oxidoreductase N-terminal domain-containing protein [Enterovibrio sp. ZSDZ35]MDD1782783.1 GMC family oxidoreductase N-terminal domain-containing protein [Enterovibrio sp. ZSDZ35]
METSYDYIVVGGGSAGCVVAAKLSAIGTVLLLEAGHSHHHPLLDMPPGIFKMINGSKYMRYHTTTPQAHLDGRQHDIPQGHVLGGGSSVNAQVYMRGRPSDYDEWQSILSDNDENPGWGWDDVLPYFKGMESNIRLNDAYHGVDGPMKVSDPGHIDDFSRWFVQAMQSVGLPFNHDFNGESQFGVGFYQFMNRNGKRSSAAYAYVEPQKDNPNLTVLLNTEVHRIVLEGEVATGVECVLKSGEKKTFTAEKEVVVSAGALVTPKLLMLSGIGDKSHLAEHGIACQLDLPGVGQNLIDHPEVPITAFANGPYGYYRQGEGWRMLKSGLQFKLFGSGPVTSAGVEAGAFVNPTNFDSPPSIQAFCVPIVYLDRDSRQFLKDDYGLTVTTVVIKPLSRGEVKLASSDPAQMPIVSPNLLKDPRDMQQMIEGQRFFLQAFSAPPLSQYIRSVAIPDPNDTSDEVLLTHCKRFVKTNYHPAGTAKMGAEGDPMAVLDAKMRIRGTRNLRVCDMSSVPNINAGNTNSVAMMLGARCADFIVG